MNRNNRKSQKLNLSLLPTRGVTSRRLPADEASPHEHMSTPSPISCLSSEDDVGLRSSISPEATSSMVLAGCPRCLMYVMLYEDDLKCPKCSSTILLDFFHGVNTSTTSKINKHGNKKTRIMS